MTSRIVRSIPSGAVRAAAAILIVAVFSAAAIVAFRSASSTATVEHDIMVSAAGCAPNWRVPGSGHPTFTVSNLTGQRYEVDLVGRDELTEYGAIETLGPRTTRTLHVALPPGMYAWRCESIDGNVTYSPLERAVGPAVAAQPDVPVTLDQLAAITTTYRSKVQQGMGVLAPEVDRLAADLTAGNLTAAKAEWLTAHLQYERLGAAYGTFGDFDARINGLPNGLPGGVHDRDFTGFHRIEYGLWHGEVASALVPIAHRLSTDVHALASTFAHLQTPPNDVALRTHEILENALQFELTGETDQGSHTNLATVRANVDGTEMTLSALAPLLRVKNAPLLTRAEHGVQYLAAVLDRYDVGGHWIAVQSLPCSAREQVDATLSALLETLSPIPDVLEIPHTADQS
ncbi:MAG TPA: EfeM/EfeO family lipoprotein [Acidimicrobiia bacterium]